MFRQNYLIIFETEYTKGKICCIRYLQSVVHCVIMVKLSSTQFLLYFMIRIKETWCVKMSWCKFTNSSSVPFTLGLPKLV